MCTPQGRHGSKLRTAIVSDLHLGSARGGDVLRDAGLTVSPLFIHSRTGLGKTHLLQSIAAEYAAGGIRR